MNTVSLTHVAASHHINSESSVWCVDLTKGPDAGPHWDLDPSELCWTVSEPEYTANMEVAEDEPEPEPKATPRMEVAEDKPEATSTKKGI